MMRSSLPLHTTEEGRHTSHARNAICAHYINQSSAPCKVGSAPCPLFPRILQKNAPWLLFIYFIFWFELLRKYESENENLDRMLKVEDLETKRIQSEMLNRAEIIVNNHIYTIENSFSQLLADYGKARAFL